MDHIYTYGRRIYTILYTRIYTYVHPDEREMRAELTLSLVGTY